MEFIDQWVAAFASFVWGFPLLILLVGGGIYLIIKSHFLPFRYLGHSIDLIRGKYDEEGADGEISHFAALSTALASTIGMGNIAGVAVAIALGGPGAIFWMWVSGVIGMSTKFFTCTLSIMYRGRDSEGAIQGGPMYFIMEGLGAKWKPAAVFFSLAGLIGALPVFNVNQLTQAIGDILLIPNGIAVNTATNASIGLVLIVVTSIVIFGGLKRISNTASKLVPAMVLLYFVLVGIVLYANFDRVPYYLSLIVTDAFAAEHYSGDPLFGGVVGALILLGIRRGAFSNEAGIGTAPMAHGAAKTDEPVREGLVAMMGPAIDTLVVCTLTALAILVTETWITSDSNGVSLTATAFQGVFGNYGPYLLLVCIAVFSISSLFTFSYYGTKCLSFLIGAHRSHWYNYFYIASIIIGATFSLNAIINLIDGFYALMAFPTMTATLLLSNKVISEARKYFKKMKS
jgi:AGCS family alanine or glycine:cation symporter